MSDISSDFFSTAITKPSNNFGRPSVVAEAAIYEQIKWIFIDLHNISLYLTTKP
jgi:hypothetical protein